MRMRISGPATILMLLAPVLAWPQVGDTPRPETKVKGKVVDVGATTIRLQTGQRPPVTYEVAPALRATAKGIRKGSEVVATVQQPAGGTAVVVAFVSITAPTREPSVTDRTGDPAARRGTVLVTADRDCDLTIDLTRKVKVPKGGTTLDLAPGEHLFTAVAEDGAQWSKTVKVGTDQTVVEIVLGAPPTPPAQLDAAAAQAWLALLDVGVAGRRVAHVLSRTNFDFHDPGLAATLQRAHGRLRREAESLGRLVGADWRRDAQAELARAAEAANRYVDLLTQSVTRAQQDGTVLGEAATLRAKALAEEPALAVDPKVMASLRGSADFARAVPPDRRPAAGLPPDPQDFALDAEYDDGAPPALGIVNKGGLADGLGLQAGDRVLAIEGQAPTGGWHLKQLLRAAAGKKVAVEVERRGKRSTLRASVPASLPK